MSRDHVLVVSLPCGDGAAAAGARRDRLVARLLTEGRAVTLLTHDDISAALVGDDPRDVAGAGVVRVPVVSHPGDPLVSRWPAPRIADPTAWAARDSEARDAAWAGDELALTRPRLQSAALAIQDDRPVSLVVACTPSAVSLSVAVLLERLLDVPYSVDLADSTVPALGDWWPWMARSARAITSAADVEGALTVPTWEGTSTAVLHGGTGA